jgi:opacity protein-like surface antigen
MPASTFISRHPFVSALALLATLSAVSPLRSAMAADPTPPSGGGTDRTVKPEDEDFSSTPYTEYGSFNEDKEEEENNKFFQYGRFFGISLGLGLETVDGDRGTLYQGGFPTFDAKIHYWFDFNFALDINFYLAEHYFISSATLFNGRFNVNILRLGVDFKYYFDTKNLAAAISFANPYVVLGAGSYTKTESSATGQTSVSDSTTAVGFSGGAGMEFALKPRRVYFTVEGKIHIVTFNDNDTQAFQASNGLPDLHGNFYTFVGSILFTW